MLTLKVAVIRGEINLQKKIGKSIPPSRKTLAGNESSINVKSDVDKLKIRMCGIDYDFIGGFENLEKEVRHILEISGLKQANISPPEIKTSKTSSKISFFYSQLSKQLLNRLIRIFRGDFEMFENDIPMSIFSGNSGVRSRVSLRDR